jgi:hypothetical protein
MGIGRKLFWIGGKRIEEWWWRKRIEEEERDKLHEVIRGE